MQSNGENTRTLETGSMAACALSAGLITRHRMLKSGRGVP